MKILIVTGQGIGNMIMCSPLILATAQKYKTKVDVLTLPTWSGSSQVLKHKVVNKIYENEQPPDHYDLVIQTWWGIQRDKRVKEIKFNADKVIISPNPDYFNQHEIDQNLSLIGWTEEAPKQYVWNNEMIEFDKGSSENKFIGIHAGSFGGAWWKKEWNKFPELVEKLLDMGFKVRNFGTEKERLNINHENYTEWAGELCLESSIDEMSYCSYFISNDSGLMHTADALNIPLIALFGPTLITKSRPVNKDSHVLTGELACQPCQYTQDFSECKDNQCLKLITVDNIIDYMKRLEWC